MRIQIISTFDVDTHTLSLEERNNLYLTSNALMKYLKKVCAAIYVGGKITLPAQTINLKKELHADIEMLTHLTCQSDDAVNTFPNFRR